MKTSYIISLSIGILLISCNGQTNQQKGEIADRNSINQDRKTKQIDNPRDLVKNYNGENNKLFVFVGEKISVDTLPYEEGSMDGGFKAKYLIIQKIFGVFSQDTIEFLAYDHYGVPDFSKFKNVLLFVSADSGLYYHQKYQYNDVYRTKDGRWAGTYSDDYEHEYNKKTKVKPVKIDFAQPLSYPLQMITEQGDTLSLTFPMPYFKITRDSAIAIYGNYIDELFVFKKRWGFDSKRNFQEWKAK